MVPIIYSVMFTLSLMHFLSLSVNLISAKANTNQKPLAHKIVKRQSPSLSQASYAFTTNCASGAQVGFVTANSYAGGNVFYSVDPSTGSPSYVNVNPVSGQITLTGQQINWSTSFIFNVRATNNYGTISVPVTVTCSPFAGTGGIGYGTGYGFGYGYGSGTGFAQQLATSYLTAYSCAPGSVIGTVNIPGATGYYITGGNSLGAFSISPFGVITSTIALTSGVTYRATVYGITYGSSTSTSLPSLPIVITIPSTATSCTQNYQFPNYG